MDMQIAWWHWLVLGLVLVVAEIAAASGFYILFFGIGALIVGALAAFGWAGPEWMQLLLFTFISLVSLALFRGRLLKMVQPDPQAPTVDQLVGEVAIVVDDLTPGTVGKVELRGSAWSARLSSGGVAMRGARCRVTRVDGLMLYVEPEGAR